MGILDGKVAIVTGASRGIGAEIARRFAAEGAAVAVAARTTDTGTSPFPGTIAETVEQIRAAGGTAAPIRADLSKPEDRERLVAEATRAARPGGHPGQQRRRHLLHPGHRLHRAPLPAHVRRPGGGPVPPGPAGRAGDAGEGPGLDPEHLLDRRPAPGVPALRVGPPRRDRLRHVQGGPGTVLHRPGRRTLRRRHRGQRALAHQGGPHSRHALPPPDHARTTRTTSRPRSWPRPRCGCAAASRRR